jgi:hypothetical protein
MAKAKLESFERLPKLPVNYRLSLLAIQLIAATAKRMSFYNTSVIEIAVRKYAREVLGERRYREIERGVEVFGSELYAEVMNAKESKRQ